MDACECLDGELTEIAGVFRAHHANKAYLSDQEIGDKLADLMGEYEIQTIDEEYEADEEESFLWEAYKKSKGNLDKVVDAFHARYVHKQHESKQEIKYKLDRSRRKWVPHRFTLAEYEYIVEEREKAKTPTQIAQSFTEEFGVKWVTDQTIGDAFRRIQIGGRSIPEALHRRAKACLRVRRAFTTLEKDWLVEQYKSSDNWTEVVSLFRSKFPFVSNVNSYTLRLALLRRVRSQGLQVLRHGVIKTALYDLAILSARRDYPGESWYRIAERISQTDAHKNETNAEGRLLRDRYRRMQDRGITIGGLEAFVTSGYDAEVKSPYGDSSYVGWHRPKGGSDGIDDLLAGVDLGDEDEDGDANEESDHQGEGDDEGDDDHEAL